MFKIGDRIVKIKASGGFENTIGDVGVVKQCFGRSFILEIVEGSNYFKGIDYIMTEVNNWELLVPESLENK